MYQLGFETTVGVPMTKVYYMILILLNVNARQAIQSVLQYP